MKLEEDSLFHVSFLSDSPVTQHSYSLMAQKTGWILAEVVRLDSGCFRVGPVGNGFRWVLSPSAANLQTLFWVCIGSSSVRVYYFDCDLLMENPALQVEERSNNNKNNLRRVLWKGPFEAKLAFRIWKPVVMTVTQDVIWLVTTHYLNLWECAFCSVHVCCVAHESVCEGYCASGTAHLPAPNFRHFDIWNLRVFMLGVPDFGLFAPPFLRCMTYRWWCYCVEGMLLPGLCFLGWYQGFCIRTCPRGPCVFFSIRSLHGRENELTGSLGWDKVLLQMQI